LTETHLTLATDAAKRLDGSPQRLEGRTRKETVDSEYTLPALFLALLICAPLRSGAQQPAAPRVSGSLESVYGVPEPVELEEIARGVGNYHKKTVRTKAVIDHFGSGYYLLRGPGGVQVLGIPVAELAYENVLGREVEIVGLVRQIPEQQQVLRCGPESQCEDPLLPALPNRRSQLAMPPQSITYWKIVELTDPGGPRPAGKDLTLESLVFKPGQHDNQMVRVIGQFRGRNLYGDLPAKSERGPLDWVISEGPYAVWVIGKKPKGSGWSLDVMLKSDSGKWIEVRGKPETVDGVTYLKAHDVRLTRGPTSTPPE
jgi:hypothetical protein